MFFTGGEKIYGRNEAPTSMPGLLNISKEQFKLYGNPRLGPVTITSLGINPTKIIHSSSSSSSVLLHRNQSTKLSLGDRVLLSAINQDDTLDQAVYVEVRKEEGDDSKEDFITINNATTTTSPPPSSSVVLLLLVGVPGSGKSTLSSSLITNSSSTSSWSSRRRWIRVNQDTIKAGKRGTRAQCINAARTALEAGTSVIIDRCNVDQEQRRDFIQLAKDLMSVQNKKKKEEAENGTFGTTGTGDGTTTTTTSTFNNDKPPVNVQLHCIILDIPLEVCKQRAGDRKYHEGELQGKHAYAVVNRMYKQMKKAELPSSQKGSGSEVEREEEGEGFSSVMHCLSDADVEVALHIWKNSNGDDVKEQWERYVDHDRKAVQGGGMKMKTIKSYFSGTGTGTDKEKKHRVVVLEEGKKTGNNKDNKGKQQQQPSSKRKDCFQEMMAAAKKRPPSPPPPPRPKQQTTTTTTTTSNSRHTFPYFPSVQVLANAADNPQQYASLHPQSLPIYVDDHVVRIPDGYPKSRAHCLVIARDGRLDGPLDLISSDVVLVKHMVERGRAWASSISSSSSPSSSSFKYGFHAVPSCRRLHLHVLSDDMDSVYLKNKKHWNSFTTEFFLDVDDVIKTLEGGKRLEYEVEEKEALLKRDMKCHKCGEMLRNMPNLKEHLRKVH